MEGRQVRKVRGGDSGIWGGGQRRRRARAVRTVRHRAPFNCCVPGLCRPGAQTWVNTICKWGEFGSPPDGFKASTPENLRGKEVTTLALGACPGALDL